MGQVVGFPKHQARASAIEPRGAAGFACIAASTSKVTPSTPLRSAIRTKGSQYSPPIRPRCAHLLMAVAEMSSPSALKSSDMTSREGQSSTRARGVSIMPGNLGPFVLNVKADVSYDLDGRFSDHPAMADRMTETEERAAFIGRTRAARMARFPKQGPMLTILDLDQGTYKQYETRTPLPWRLIPKFCAATGVDIEWLLTGEGEGPKVTALPEPRKRTSKPAKRQAA